LSWFVRSGDGVGCSKCDFCVGGRSGCGGFVVD